MKKDRVFALAAGAFVLFSSVFCVTLTPRPALSFLPDTLPDGKVGLAYRVDILVGGNATPVGNYSISEGSLPAGLELVMDQQAHSAHISGTPAQSGTFKFTVSVWCYGTNVNGQTGEKQYTLVVGE